ncbi:MAG: hypothetical protein U0517_01175 [Candidatus Andersenbacteria bacterium]
MVLALLLELLLLAVAVRPKIHDADDRRASVGAHFDQIQVGLLGHLEGLPGLDNA